MKKRPAKNCQKKVFQLFDDLKAPTCATDFESMSRLGFRPNAPVVIRYKSEKNAKKFFYVCKGKRGSKTVCKGAVIDFDRDYKPYKPKNSLDYQLFLLLLNSEFFC